MSESASCGAVLVATFNVKRGVDVPRPRLPAVESKVNCVATPPFPKRTVEEAERPFPMRRGVEVEFALTPKLVVGVHGNAKFV